MCVCKETCVQAPIEPRRYLVPWSWSYDWELLGCVSGNQTQVFHKSTRAACVLNC